MVQMSTMNPLPRPPAIDIHDARLLDARAYEYAQRHSVSTIYGLALTTEYVPDYMAMRGVRIGRVAAGVLIEREDGDFALVAPIFMNGKGWLYLVSDLVAAAKGA